MTVGTSYNGSVVKTSLAFSLIYDISGRACRRFDGIELWSPGKICKIIIQFYFDIPVMIEYSSYEQHPLGKVEWVKFFGALTGKEAEAEAAFAEQAEILETVSNGEKTGKTVAFFYVTSNGLIQVRQSTDYIPKLIELAGGRYIFDDLEDSGSGRSTLNMQIEDFYAGAKDADILIYNSSIDGGVNTIDELIDKCNILKDFKAVQDGQVYCTTNDMYQQSMAVGYLLKDMHTVLTGDDSKNLKYLFLLE